MKKKIIFYSIIALAIIGTFITLIICGNKSMAGFIAIVIFIIILFINFISSKKEKIKFRKRINQTNFYLRNLKIDFNEILLISCRDFDKGYKNFMDLTKKMLNSISNEIDFLNDNNYSGQFDSRISILKLFKNNCNNIIFKTINIKQPVDIKNQIDNFIYLIEMF